MSERSQNLGTEPIGPLLRKQAIPAGIGILILSIYGIIDTIFVGRYIGAYAIGAITVVLPITFFIASIGMSIGVGGASIISRALGAGQREKAFLTFGNQVTMTLIMAIGVVILGFMLQDQILWLFGGKGEVLPYAQDYFRVILIGIPFLAWAMMSNNVIRAEGRPKVAMYTMVVPAIVNIFLDPVFILVLDMGIAGAAWATTLSYIASAAYASYYFIGGPSELKIRVKNLLLDRPIVREITSIGFVTFARQGTISLLSIILNNALFTYGGEMGLSIYGIINRLMMFANFPVLGVTQGFIPIAGYNYGAEKYDRVKAVIYTALKYGTLIAFCIFVCILTFSQYIPKLFTNEALLISLAAPAIIKAFLATPLITVQLIGSAYYQAIGKAVPALLLTLTKQGFFLIPLILTLPSLFGLEGIWYAFPIADVLSASVVFYFLRKGMTDLDGVMEGAAPASGSETLPQGSSEEVTVKNL